MKKFKIIIRSTETKVLTVFAENEDDAIDDAHELFELANSAAYDEEVISAELLSND